MLRDASAWSASAEIAGIALLVAAIVAPGLGLHSPSPPPEITRAPGGGPVTARESTRWEELMRPPPPRISHAMAFDSARAEVVLTGGRGDALFGDTWEWNGTRWALRADAGPTRPSPRALHALAFDDARRKVLLFGGGGAGGPLGDTWEWSGTAWTQIVTRGSSPPPRAGAAMAFDTSRQRAVLFGGEATATLGDTWEWDGNAWSAACTSATCKASAPPARSFAAAAYDGERHRVVLFGGKATDGAPLGDTWEWDGTQWIAACGPAPCATSPSPRSKHALAFDARAKVTVLFGGEATDVGALQDTWTWTGSEWKRACLAPCSFATPASQSGHAMAYDANRHAVVLVTGDLRGQTWEWDGASWAERKLSPPSPRDGHAMAFDANRARAVLFGGGTCERSACTDLGDTWEWDGVSWLRVCTDAACQGHGPAARTAHALAYDRGRMRTVVFGGTSGGLDRPLNDTWEWDGATWTAACASSPCADTLPPPRFAHAMTYDVARRVSVLFGGQGKGVRLGDTWEWNGVAWLARCTAPPCSLTAPSARSRHTLMYDAKRARTVLFGGIDGPAEADTWEWDGTRWEQLHPPTSPAPRAYGALSYNPVRGVIALFGGAGGTASFADGWEWDGSAWSRASDVSSPPGRTAHAMAFDEAGSRLLVFGGFGESVLLGDTWEHRRVGGACKADAECEGGRCVDGVCCESACGVCERCDGASPGACAPVVSAEDDGSCGGDSACDASGRCRRKDGRTCSDAGECVSGFCVDGVCCNTACTETCRACRADLKNAPTDGICGDVVNGKDPHDDCADDGACSCGHDGACNGAGACRLYTRGTSCAGCSSLRAPDDVCDGLGACASTTEAHCLGEHTIVFGNGVQKDCAPYRCSSAGVCLETCASNDDCAAPTVCHANGACGQAPSVASAPEAPPVIDCGIAAGGAARGGWVFGGAIALAAFGLRKRTRGRHE